MERKRRKEKKGKGKSEKGSEVELKGGECVPYLKSSGRTCVFMLYFRVQLKYICSYRKVF